MNVSFQKLFFAIATGFAFFAVLILAETILIPLSFALLFSFILFPMTKKIEAWGCNRILASFSSIFFVFIIIGGGIYLFSAQIIELSNELSQFKDKIINVFADVTVYINKNVSFVENLEKNELIDRVTNKLKQSTGTLAKETFQSTTDFITGFSITIIFTFLFLVSRYELTQAFLAFFPKNENNRVLKMFKSIQQIGQKYLLGMSLLVLILGFANSIGLWIIGLDHPFLFGFLGAMLSIIPYVGTVLGAIIPIVYAFISFDSPWNAISVAILFWIVQLITDNFLSPKIVGGSLKLNALAAILSLIIGAMVWGVAGMILFLPFAAMLKIVSQEYIELKPIALLIGSQDFDDKSKDKTYINRFTLKIKQWFKKS